MLNRFAIARKISLLTTLLLLLGSVWAFGAIGGSSTAGNYSFVTTDDGTVVVGYLGEGFADVIVPNTLGGRPVVAIGSGAFWGNSDIRSVLLPPTVTDIGSNAFTDCSRLAKLSATGVTTLGDYALYGCDELVGIMFSGDITTLGKQVLGSSHPAISVSSGCTIDDLLRVYHLLGEQESLLLGSVGSVMVTDELLALNSSLGRLLDSTETITVEGLWAADAVMMDNLDGSTTKMSYIELESRLRSSGLYGVLEPSKRARLQLRLDAVLEALLIDAKRL